MRFRKQPAPVGVVVHLNAGVALLDGAAARGGRYALTYIDSVGVIERATFADVRHKSRQWSHLLLERGLEPGDRVVLLAECDREWRSAMLGVLQAGGVVVPCAASTPVAELSEMAEHVSGKRIFFVSTRARPDLEDAARGLVLTIRELDARGAAKAAPPPHQTSERDVALIFCTRRADGLESAMHTHASLVAEAEAGESWLAAGRQEGVWSTVDDGSPASVWFMLAAWGAGAELVALEAPLAPREQVELLARLRPAAVWFQDGEYARLAAEGESSAFAVGSIGRVLTDGTGEGAGAFADAFGAPVAHVPELDEKGALLVANVEAEPAASPVPAIRVAETDGEDENAGEREEVDRWSAAEQALREQEEREAEEQRLADEAVAREQAERRRVEEEQRREEERRREAEHAIREQEQPEADEQRLADEAAAREQAERLRVEEERRREAEEQERHAQALGEEEERRHGKDEKRRAEQPPHEAPRKSGDEQLAPSILSQITAYGGGAKPD